jgi:AcrR family transcriptional regulator
LGFLVTGDKRMNLHSMTRAVTQPTDKYDAILDAALQLFSERGFHGTAVPAVAERAGVAAGTIYHYFSSKEALVNALFRKWKEQIARSIYTAFPHGMSPREQFRNMWNQMATFALAHPKAFAFIEFHHHASYLDNESIALDRTLKQFGVAYVTQAQAAGVMKQHEPLILLELVLGAFHGLMKAHIDGRLTLDKAKLDALELVCWDAVKA